METPVAPLAGLLRIGAGSGVTAVAVAKLSSVDQ